MQTYLSRSRSKSSGPSTQAKRPVVTQEANRSSGVLYYNSDVIQRQSNKTGLPDTVKQGIENLSGYDLSDVNVHYNSDHPASVNALAYTQGTDIHLAPGQEEYLPHEAWHVVQQKQGRVQQTLQMKSGERINDDDALEQEADRMGKKALGSRKRPSGAVTIQRASIGSMSIIQRGGGGSKMTSGGSSQSVMKSMKNYAVFGSFRPPVTHGFMNNASFKMRGSEGYLTIPAIKKVDPTADMGAFLKHYEDQAREQGATKMKIELSEVINDKLGEQSYWDKHGYKITVDMDIPDFGDVGSASERTIEVEKELSDLD